MFIQTVQTASDMLALVSKATQVKIHQCPELYYMEAKVSYIFITIQVTTG